MIGATIEGGRFVLTATALEAALTPAARVLLLEHQIYPRAIELFAAGRLKFGNGAAWLDGKRLDEPLQFP